MRTLLDAAIAARDLITWSNDCYHDVERLIQANKYQDAIELANNYVEQERARRKRKALGREPEKN
jgi:hypothetical protein